MVWHCRLPFVLINQLSFSLPFCFFLEQADAEASHISEPLKEDHVVSVHLSNGDVNVRERVMNGFANVGSDKRDNMCNGVAPTNVNEEEAKKKQHVEEVVPSQQDAPKKSYALIVSYSYIILL